MMVVSVQFQGAQREVTRKREIEVPVSRDARVKDVIAYVKGCYPELTLTRKEVLITVNNTVSNKNHVLKSNDKITFVPHIGGG
jgi:molybdopterin converting factor small subunit